MLLLSEYERVHGEARQDTGEESLLQARGDHLLEEGDSFIANRVSATLKDGELGVLFMGAHHDVVSRLAADISVETVKDREKLQAYFDELFAGHDDSRLEDLGRYLASPISAS